MFQDSLSRIFWSLRNIKSVSAEECLLKNTNIYRLIISKQTDIRNFTGANQNYVHTWYWLTRPIQKGSSAQSADRNQIQSSACWRNDPQKLSPKENLQPICRGKVLASSSHTAGICKMPLKSMEVCLTCRFLFFFSPKIYIWLLTLN